MNYLDKNEFHCLAKLNRLCVANRVCIRMLFYVCFLLTCLLYSERFLYIQKCWQRFSVWIFLYVKNDLLYLHKFINYYVLFNSLKIN